jgi:hypothetical protein
MDSMLIVVVSSLTGGAVAYLGALINSSLAMRTHIDQSLREIRISVYKDLWRRTGLLPQWPKSREVTYAKLADFSRDLRHWYFNEGGIYLSTESRAVYGSVQETVQAVISGGEGKILEEEYDRGRNSRRMSSHDDVRFFLPSLSKDFVYESRVSLSL